MKKSVYCYARVSSRGQAKDGYGMSRQQAVLYDYVTSYNDAEHGRGYELGDINWLFAEGVSAYSGKNIANGSVLKNFIDDVVRGKIINAVLVIENMDRFSRAEPIEAANLFLSLIVSGCDIHEVETETIHHPKSDLNIISGGLMRAHNESKRKAKLSIKNWDKRIKQTVDGNGVLTGRVPGWLTVEDGRYKIKEGEKEKFELIFTMYTSGNGPAAIRDELKKRKLTINDVEPTIQHLHKFIKDRRLIGEFHSGTGRKILDGTIVYPQVVSTELFEKAQVLRTDKRPNKLIKTKIKNLFAGLCICPNCERFHVVNGVDKRGDTYMRCGGSLSGSDKCKTRGFKYKLIENVMLDHMRNFDFGALKSDESADQIRLNQLTTELFERVNYRDEIMADIENEEIPDPEDRRVLKNVKKRIADIENEIVLIKQASVSTMVFGELRDSITNELRDIDSTELRTTFNTRLRRVISKMYVQRFDNVITLVIYYVGIDETQAIMIDIDTGEVLYSGVQNNTLKTVEHLIKTVQ